MKRSSLTDVSALQKASALMEKALVILDAEHHHAAARLDHAIVELGMRPLGEGMPVGW